MQASWAVWDRDLPLRCVVVWENEDGQQELWAKATGVEGLFTDPVPPRREVLTLRGCEPTGLLSAAIAAADGHTAFGSLCVEVWDVTSPVEWWGLVDVTIIAQRSCATDPLLVDIVIGAGVEEPDGRCQPLPESPRFELVGDWG